MSTRRLPSSALSALLVLGAGACSHPLVPPAMPPPALSATTKAAPHDLSRQTVALTQTTEHVCRIDGTGQLWCWGANHWGQVRPDARTLVEPLPVAYPGLDDVKHVALASDHACVIHRDGKVSCWGHNEAGQVGDGTTAPRFAPERIAGLTNVDALALDVNVSCAHERGKSWWCWGGTSASMGVHGLESTHLGTLLPGIVPKGPTEVRRLAGVSALALTTGSGAALHESGQVLAWGYSGDSSSWEAPVPVPGLDDALDVRVGDMDGCALRRGGTVSCWATFDLARSLETVAGLDHVRSLFNFGSAYCAQREDHSLVCWQSGQYSTIIPKEERSARDIVAMSAVHEYGCTATADGTLTCRGSNTRGQLGDGRSVITPTPTVVPGLTEVASVDTAMEGNGLSTDSSTCALRDDGTVWCWGAQEDSMTSSASGYDELRETHYDRTLPTPVEGVSDAVELHAPCVRKRDHSIVCWDATRWGRLIRGTATPSPLVVVRGIGTRLLNFDVKGGRGCGNTADGRVFCWGTRDLTGRAQQLKGLHSVVEVAMGTQHACARMRSGSVSCWGHNEVGQLGDGTRNWGRYINPRWRVATDTPVPVLDLKDATALWAAHNQTCVRRRGDDAPWCFGDFAYNGPTGLGGSLAPMRIPSLAGLESITLGAAHQCGIDSAGALHCMGNNLSAALGSNAADTVEHVPLADRVQSVSAGATYTCAVRERRVLCWGDSSAGQLGLGLWHHYDDQGSVRF